MAKATLDPNLQAIADKVFDEAEVVREVVLLGIRMGKFTREDVLKDLQEGKYPPETAKALWELFKPTPSEPRPKPKSDPKKSDPKENRRWQRRYLPPIMRKLWQPDGVPPEDLTPGDIVRQVERAFEAQYGRERRLPSRSTILRAAGRLEG
jgi:hypothetical protein